MPHSDEYFAGWHDSIAELHRRLDETGEGCLACRLDEVRFTGMAMAAGDTHDGTANVVLAGQVAERFLVTALGDDHREQVLLLRRARALVTRQPAAAVELIVLLVLLSAKRYGPYEGRQLEELEVLTEHHHEAVDEHDPEHDPEHEGRDYWR